MVVSNATQGEAVGVRVRVPMAMVNSTEALTRWVRKVRNDKALAVAWVTGITAPGVTAKEAA